MEQVIDSERSIAAIVRDVAGNLGRIVRAEVRLARLEVTELLSMGARRSGTAAALLVAGVAVGQLALGFLLFALVRGFESVVAPWLAALVVAAAAAAVAAILLASGVKHMRRVGVLSPLRIATSMEDGR